MKNITCPPASKLAADLNLDEDTASRIRAKIKAGYRVERGTHWSHAATAWMEEISKLGDFSGVESLYPEFPHIMYCNAGDSYASTLIFNHQTEQVRIGCIGDILERLRPCSAQY